MSPSEQGGLVDLWAVGGEQIASADDQSKLWLYLFCPGCGWKRTGKFSICPRCGEDLRRIPCPYCGGLIPAVAKICPRCTGPL